MTSIKLLLFAIFCLLATHAQADSAPYMLTGETSKQELQGHVSFFIDEDWTMTPEQVFGPNPPVFSTVDGKNTDFGYTTNRIWLRISVQNNTADQEDWLWYFPENFKQHFRVDVLSDDGQIERVLELNETSPFSARPIPYPEMLAPVKIAPGESATILISLWSEGSSYIAFSVHTPESFAALSAQHTAKNFMFYGMMTLMIVAALVAMVLLRNLVLLAYSTYASSAMLYVMHVDGVAFQYLWPMAPGFNNMASVFTGGGVIVFGAIYSRMFLKTKVFHPRIDKALIAIVVVTLALIAVLYVPNPQLLKKLLIFLSLVAILTFASAGFIASRKRFSEIRFYLLAWLGAVVSVTLLNLNHLFGVQLSQSFVYESMRLTIVFDAAMMGLAVLDRYNQLRKSESIALTEKLNVAQRNIDLSTRLAELTGRYRDVETQARIQNEQIENTVHDLRQPLHALRMKVSSLINEEQSANVEPAEVNAAISYLEDLMSNYLDSKRDADPNSQPSVQQQINLRHVLQSIQDMFASDASDKGIRLTTQCPDVETSIEPLDVMRVVSNLVSNAVNYSAKGSVHIQAEESECAILISVTDTGPGITQDEFSQALMRDLRLLDKVAEAKGHGLGLSIAKALCDKNGMTLKLIDTPKAGTTIQVSLPR